MSRERNRRGMLGILTIGVLLLVILGFGASAQGKVEINGEEAKEKELFDKVVLKTDKTISFGQMRKVLNSCGILEMVRLRTEVL